MNPPLFGALMEGDLPHQLTSWSPGSWQRPGERRQDGPTPAGALPMTAKHATMTSVSVLVSAGKKGMEMNKMSSIVRLRVTEDGQRHRLDPGLLQFARFFLSLHLKPHSTVKGRFTPKQSRCRSTGPLPRLR